MRLQPLALALAAVGCGGASATDDAARPVDAAMGAPDSPRVDVGAGAPCGLGGTGRLRVAVTVDPALLRRSPEVWLSARCGADDRVVRLVRWDRSATMVLDGFGPGAYSVVASSLLASPARTARVDVNALSTASLSVTLPAEPAALATVRAGAGVSGTIDAGASPGDAVAPADVALRPTWTGRAQVDDPMLLGGVGSAEVEAVQVSPEGVEVRVLVRNTCAASSVASCPTLELTGAEARALVGDAPHDVAFGEFERTRLAAGESVTLTRPMALRGELPGPRSALQLSVYGTITRASAGAMRP